MLAAIGEALITIHRETGAMLECNSAAESLLGLAGEQLSGNNWEYLLRAEGAAPEGLEYLLRSSRPVSLPPFLYRCADGGESVLAGLLLPPREGTDELGLLLWRVLAAGLPPFEASPQEGDCIAVLGVDRIRADAGAGETAVLIENMRRRLAEILRAGDTVSGVLGTSMVILIRNTDLDGARDISRALMSHLHRILRQGDSDSFSARLRLGLARHAPGRSALSALLSADRAMLQARFSWASQQVRVEDALDFRYLLTDAIQGGGVFGGAADMQSAAARPRTVEETSRQQLATPQVQPMERDVAGYVVDNMEGAVDQAMFLARLDVPVAIIGAAGTGKMYVAKILHEASGGSPEMLVAIDCREFRGRKQAEALISRELSRGEGKTLVFKSPHLMHADAQQKLARCISSRTLSDVSPPRALTGMKFVALFPQELERLIRKTELIQPLASAFGGFPIHVPPIKDRKQAVLRWAHKILGQEGVQRDREMKGFTPDAEQAMLLYDWPGNISEMRQCIHDALDKTEKTWLTPVDLGLFDGIDPEGAAYVPESTPYLAAAEVEDEEDGTYTPSTLESLDVALGQAVKGMLELGLLKPLGTWLDDELVLASLERYRDDLPKTGVFLHTKPRNISRWLPKITAREEERATSALWQSPRRLLREWVREISPLEESPMRLLQDKLLAHIEEQSGSLSSARRAQIFGVSTPTYLKRLKEN